MSADNKPTQKSALKVIMGAMTFGEAAFEQARVTDVKEVAAILDVFQAHGHSQVDTARLYCNGTSEEYLGKLDWQKRGLAMDTKLKIHIFYLHGPDRQIPYEVTLKAVNDLYKEGYFEHFGISNYMAWEVAEIVQICKASGYIQPTVYQGIYNAIHRGVEPELFPCLRKYGMSFYEYNPLAGGFFTGRYTRDQQTVEPGSRFDPNKAQGKGYRYRYWNDATFDALESVKAVGEKHGLSLAEIALRWVSHHSLLKREHGDAILIGASSVQHIEQNLIDLEQGPLPDEVIKALDNAWAAVKGIATPYFH
ncbi:Aldo/keto reductase [Gloeophyllum trabeum ATCC 11539]|uniref:Aldo/keto reductase n=1 Tax=Gloeophyllum trabeum (strain ATCC 11539 / FP-39264 / Madison 617) TaxID=670483 RepID=S7RVN5_GLOTA|nr:Aldo/keto reductase [Gloeophyllum trabeum ATCC 11539]EPQ58870.1 Aldo/keto reductase [Gloeophyllum trabeum ATCC 11539]